MRSEEERRGYAPDLNKGQVLSGMRCHKKLWLEFHDPESEYLKRGADAEMRLAEGRVVGEHARRHMGAGVNLAPEGRVAQPVVVQRTSEAIARGETVLFEPGFTAGGGSIRADILQKDGDSWRLIEVKSSKWPEKERDRERKFDAHLPDVAVQSHVVRSANLPVTSTHLMYLNPDCRHPDLSNLFTTVEVTRRVEPIAQQMPDLLASLHDVLRGTEPTTPTGAHCSDPDDCPFYDKCHDGLPDHHVTELYYIKRQSADALAAAGKTLISQLDESDGPNVQARRQIRAIRQNRRIVEPGLVAELAVLKSPIAHLDFETVQLAVPRWPGCGPQDQVAVQFSVHRGGADGGDEHIEFLAERGGDPRPALIRALIDACAGAGTILVYYEQFEKSRIRELGAWFPEYAAALDDINARIVDLLPIVRNHVYDPGFHGSFSLKNVLPALVNGLNYEDLNIREGGAAAAAIYRLLFGEEITPDAARALRTDLLAYCKRDTEAMVRLLGVLRTLTT